MKNILRIRISLICILFICGFSAGSAWANTAANTQIINNAVLSYNNGVSLQTSAAAVTVLVSLVPSPPNITPGSPQTTSYSGPSTKLSNSFTVTATANGPDTYTIASTITASTNTSGATSTPELPSVYLGATVTTTGSTTTVLNVPSDGVSGSKVNGIQVGNTVVVGAATCTVSSISNTGSGVATITISPALSAAPAAGVLVAQQAVVLVDVAAGTVSTPGTSITATKAITLTSTTNTSVVSPQSGGITDTFTTGVATLTKYVRNVTTSMVPASPGATYSYNSNTYYPSNAGAASTVTAKPGDILEYILVSTNSGTGPVTASVVTDTLPIAYVKLNLSAYGGSGKDITYVSDSGTVSIYTAAADTDAATYVSATGLLTVNIGTGATNSAGGSIPGGNKTELVLYQAQIN